MPDPPPQVLPPATTTKNDLRAAASGFFAQRRRNVQQESAAPPGAHSQEELRKLVENAYADERAETVDNLSTSPPVAKPLPPRKWDRDHTNPAAVDPLYEGDDVTPPDGALQVGQRLRLSELAERVAEAKRARSRIVRSGDVDGDDSGGYDPREIIREVRAPEHGASMAASVLGALNEKRRPR